jgi:hypothetical protein
MGMKHMLWFLSDWLKIQLKVREGRVISDVYIYVHIKGYIILLL